MKTILCFGDSNTWGFDPATGRRFDRAARWTGVLRRELGDGYEVVEEGLNGRTTVREDPVEGDKNGRRHFLPILESHMPLDLVVIMLGTNDLKHRFGLSAWDIASSVGVLAELALGFRSKHAPGSPKVMLMAPPPLARLTGFADLLEGGTEKSRQLGRHYRRVAGECGCEFLDAGEVIVSSDRDGIHFEAEEHAKLGRAVAGKVREILG